MPRPPLYLIFILLSACWLGLVSPAPAVAQDETTAEQDSTGEMAYVPIEDGSVSAQEFFDAVSRDVHWVAGSVTAFARGLHGTPWGDFRLSRDQVNEIIRRFPDVFSVGKHPQTQVESLVIDVDLLAKQLADQKSGFRQYLAESQKQPLAILEKVPDTWEGQPARPARIIVVMAGLHGFEYTSEDVAQKLHERTGLPACFFHYPNDGPIAESGALLVLRLQDLQSQYPDSNITLVTHSMGGLVSRAALEMQGNSNRRSSIAQRTGVDQLIQVCPPNHGSALAEYGPLLEGAEQLYRLVNRDKNRQAGQLFRGIVDGFNEASADLEPDSRFLKELNAQARNPEVRYTILAGNGGPVGPVLGNLVGSLWERIAESVAGQPEVDRRVRKVLESPELQRGQGDGVVAIASAKLDGVEDFEVMPMHHLVWNQLDSEEGQNMLGEVARRLGVDL